MNDFHIAFFRSRQVTLQDVEESDTFVYKRERQGQRNCFSASLGPLIDIARHPLDIQNVERWCEEERQEETQLQYCGICSKTYSIEPRESLGTGICAMRLSEQDKTSGSW